MLLEVLHPLLILPQLCSLQMLERVLRAKALRSPSLIQVLTSNMEVDMQDRRMCLRQGIVRQ